MNNTVSVILPAAGTGQRMNIATPKQYCEVQGKPLICYAVEAFLRHDWISDIVVVYPRDQLTLMTTKLKANMLSNKVRFVPGGATRHRSIYNGMLHMKKSPPDIVVIHDAVRPFIPTKVSLAHSELALFLAPPPLSHPYATAKQQKLKFAIKLQLAGT